MTEVQSTEAPVSTEKQTKSIMTDSDIQELFLLGKRNLVCEDPVKASKYFQQALNYQVKKHGETAEECGETYLFYGKALLEIARMESAVLGNALEGIEDGTEDEAKTEWEESDALPEEEKERLSNEIIDAMVEDTPAKGDDEKDKSATEGTEEGEKCKENGTGEAKDEAKQMETDDTTEGKDESDDKEKVEDEKEKAEDDKEEAEGDKEEAEGDKEKVEVDKEKAEDDKEKTEVDKEEAEGDKEKVEGDKEEKNEGEESGAESEENMEEEESEGEAEQGNTSQDSQEDVSNLQLSWEVIELAKLVFAKSKSPDAKIKLADCHMKLGEIGLESEQYDQAVEDFEKCLVLRQEVGDERLIAETYYQLGMAYTYNNKHDLAIENCEKAVTLLKDLTKKFYKVVEEADKKLKVNGDADLCDMDNDFNDRFAEASNEIENLEALIPDIMAKIEDIKEDKKTAEKTKQMVIDTVKATLGAIDTIGGEKSFEMSAASGDSASKPADITHLVRKKRKVEETTQEVKDTEAKKSKTDEAGAGDS